MVWIVYSTTLSPPSILVTEDVLEIYGKIIDYTKQEWSEAYHAPSNPYEWNDSTRILIDGHVWVDGTLEEWGWGPARQVVAITVLAAIEMLMYVTIIQNLIPILDSNIWFGAGMLYFFVTNIRATNYRRFWRLLERNGAKLADYIVTNIIRKVGESKEGPQ